MVNIRRRSEKVWILVAFMFCMAAQLFPAEGVASRGAVGQTVGGPSRGPRYNHLVDEFAKEFPKVEGQGVTALILGSGAVRSTHKEFQQSLNSSVSRVTVLTKKKVGDSSTVVAGIMAARGLTPEAKGMAPSLRLISEDSEDDLRKLRKLGPGVQVSVDTDLPTVGWVRGRAPDSALGRWLWGGDEKEEEDAKFGKYLIRESVLDDVLQDFPSLLAFIPAGSSRDNGPEKQPVDHYLLTDGGKPQWDRVSNQVRKINGWDRGGLDTVSGLCLSKNAICIGTIDDISLSRPISIESYSGWGPTDDGRIKPDLVASGHNVLSTAAENDKAYRTASGSGMATAVASGISALMVQLYRRDRGGPQKRFPTSATIKAVLIHTATDAGARGPDPVFGWGSINANLAGQIIAQKDAAGKFQHIIRSERVTANAAKQYLLRSTGERIRITLVWTDPKAPANTGGLDDSTRTLQNDLDVRLISPSGTIYYPYSLDPIDPLAPARADGPNRVDNVEMIEVARSPRRAGWKLEVTARALQNGVPQSFIVVVSGLAENVAN